MCAHKYVDICMGGSCLFIYVHIVWLPEDNLQCSFEEHLHVFVLWDRVSHWPKAQQLTKSECFESTKNFCLHLPGA